MSRTPFDDPHQAGGTSAGPDGSAVQDETEQPVRDERDDAAVPAGEASEDARRLAAERDDYRERMFRAAADFKNAQRRLETEKEQALQYANASLIKSLVPVIDLFEQALKVDPSRADANSILKGMHMVHDEWLKVMNKANVELIRPEVGTPFDPNRHEAVMQQPTDKYAEPTVTQLFQNGYALHGRTLRPAKVAVSKVG